MLISTRFCLKELPLLPPGGHTASLKRRGCCPVWNTIGAPMIPGLTARRPGLYRSGYRRSLRGSRRNARCAFLTCTFVLCIIKLCCQMETMCVGPLPCTRAPAERNGLINGTESGCPRCAGCHAGRH